MVIECVRTTYILSTDEWSEEDLSVKTGLSQASLRKHVTFWMNQGVIKEVASGEFVTADSYALEGKQSMCMCVCGTCPCH